MATHARFLQLTLNASASSALWPSVIQRVLTLLRCHLHGAASIVRISP